MTDLASLLSAFMTRALGPGEIANLGRLSGGANMESWAFDWAGEGYVLRRAPSAEYMADRPYGHPTEAALVKAAHAAGVKAPDRRPRLAISPGPRAVSYTHLTLPTN